MSGSVTFRGLEVGRWFEEPGEQCSGSPWLKISDTDALCRSSLEGFQISVFDDETVVQVSEPSGWQAPSWLDAAIRLPVRPMVEPGVTYIVAEGAEDDVVMGRGFQVPPGVVKQPKPSRSALLEARVDALLARVTALELQLSDRSGVEVEAAVEHDRWSHWQRYLHAQCEPREDGSLVIPSELVARWARQMTTHYEDLSEEEKESDREQVRIRWAAVSGGPVLQPNGLWRRPVVSDVWGV